MLFKPYPPLLFLIISLSLTFCDTKNTFVQEYMGNYKDINKKIVKFPDSLYIYNSNKLLSTKDFNGSLIVITGYLDCSPCLMRLKEIEQFKDEFPKANILYFAAGEKSEYAEYQLKINHFSFPIIHDINQSFVNCNGLSKYDRTVFLVNEKNEIILIGSPFTNSVLKKYYIEALNSNEIN